MEIVVTGRRCTIKDSLREQVEERIESIERLKNKIIRVEVEFTATDVKGNPDSAVEAEITLRGKGPVVRAEARAHEKMAAFEKALEKLKAQLYKALDRRKTHRGLRATNWSSPEMVAKVSPEKENDIHEIAGLVVEGDGPLVVREKEHTTSPLTLSQALDEMELVGHDFFLYVDANTNQPSVVYRRKAYNYGVIHLNVI